MFKTRLISGIFLILIALGVLIAGGPVLFVTVTALSLIGLFELYRVFGVEKTPLAFFSYAATLLYNGWLAYGPEVDSRLLFLILFFALTFCYVFTYPKYHAKDIFQVFAGFFYVTVMLFYIYLLREDFTQGALLVWFIFICSWGADTCAYCVGMLIGKHKMAPVLSPKKSVEGGVGGVVGAMLIGFLYTYFLREQMAVNSTQILLLVLACGVGALISMVGDLTASAIKRNYEIKDYGTLIPGHGGVLDRFDSVIFTAPIIYYFAYFVLG